ncbi:SDR family oxidoreductase [Magnetospira thiophila]
MSHRPVVLVTGGSRGIGAAVVTLAAQRGYDVGFSYLSRQDKAEQLVQQVEALGATAFAQRADAADAAETEALFAAVDARFGRLDALVNNAAIITPRADFTDMDLARFRAVIETNLTGTFHAMQLALRRMSTQRGGRGGAIVNISSEAGRFGGNRISAYAASKAGVNTLTLGAARELVEHGVRVNVVSPGVIETDPLIDLPEAEKQAVVRSLPMGRMGHPEEVAETVLWLLSDAASYVAGSLLTVSGAR